MKGTFQQELTTLINQHSIENKINMPDYMIAQLICQFIESVGSNVINRDKWLGYRKENVEPPQEDLF